MAVYLIESKADQQKLIDYVGEKTAKLFFSMKDRLKSPENDIYYWLKKDPKELKDKLDILQSTKTRKQKDMGAAEGAKLIYNQDGWKVYHITTYEASVKYGKGTMWCISGSKEWENGENGEEYFNDYTSRGIEFYFYINKNGEKYALAYEGPEHWEVFSAEDTDITYEDLSFLPNVEGLPKFDNSDLLSDGDTYVYNGNQEFLAIKDQVKTLIIETDGLEDYECSGCKSLESVTVYGSVDVIGGKCFFNCPKLQEVILKDGVEYIGVKAFMNCPSLNTIRLPKSLESIEFAAFAWCDNIKTVYYGGTEKDWDRLGVEDEELLNAEIIFNS